MWPHRQQPTRHPRPWDSPGKNTGVGCHFLLLHVKIAQSCLTLCDSMDCSLPGSFVHGIFQARILEWVAISFSRGLSTCIRWNDNLPQSWRSGLHCSCLLWPRSSISPSHQNQPLTWAVCTCSNRAVAAAWENGVQSASMAWFLWLGHCRLGVTCLSQLRGYGLMSA